MKRIFKWVLRLVLLVVVLVVLLLIFKDSIVRSVIEHRVRDRTGMDVKIGKLSSSVFSPIFTLENVKVYNPAEFGGTLFLDIAELHLEFDSTELARRNVRVTLARLNLAELDVVRNERGQTNVFAVLDKVKSRTKKIGGWKKVFGDFQFTGVDTLNLTLGKVRYVDLQEPHRSSQTSLNVSGRVMRNLHTKLDLTSSLIYLWVEVGGKFPISIDDIVRLTQRWNSKTEPGGRPPAPKTNGPPRQ